MERPLLPALPMLRERSRPSSLSLHRRRLVVIEKDAPSVTCQGDESREEAVVIAQSPEETPAELAQRALQRIALAESAGQSFHEAFLCTSATDDPATRAARRLITLGVAAHADVAHGLDELVLCAPSDADFTQRESLVRLADDAVLAGNDKPLRVRLCFVNDGPAAAPELAEAS